MYCAIKGGTLPMNLIVFGSIFLAVYIYNIWIVIKEKRMIHISEMDSCALFYCIFNYILLLICLILIAVGVNKNRKVIENYKQNGIYQQGEIISHGAINDFGFCGEYTIQIVENGKNKTIYVWTSDFAYEKHGTTGVYCLYDENNHFVSAMVEEERSSKEGETFLNWSLLVFILATCIYGYRYDIVWR